MSTIRPVPSVGSVHLDGRGDRALRVSWHAEAGVVVLSIWHQNVCTGTVRLTPEQVPDLIETLRQATGPTPVEQRPLLA
ncbi:hypothetical protein GCM10028801_09620 [Nocardioides maradonensis]